MTDRFQRNQLGRIVSTIEKHKGLKITTEEFLVDKYGAYNFDKHVAYLEKRLNGLGGVQLIPAKFCFDESPSWAGVHTGETWNGWATPMFTKEVMDEMIAWFDDGSYYDQSHDCYVFGFNLDYLNDGATTIEDIRVSRNKYGLFQPDGLTFAVDESNESEDEIDA